MAWFHSYEMFRIDKSVQAICDCQELEKGKECEVTTNELEIVLGWYNSF